MRPSRLHRLLGLAQLYAAVVASSQRLDDHGRRLAKQEKAMSKLAPILAALALSVPALASAQKREADDVKKVSDTLDRFLASKKDGDPVTADELTQLQGFSDAIKAAADSSTARANDLEALVAKIPDDVANDSGATDPTASGPTDPSTTDKGGDAAPVSEPVGDPVAAPASTDSASA